MMIRVRDTVGSRALTLEEGDVLHDRIVPPLKAGEEVELDFDGVQEVATAFLNTSIGRLYAEFTSAQLTKQLRLKNLNEGAQRSLEKVLTYARKFYSVPSPQE